MLYHTTIYNLIKDGEMLTFNSEKDACNFLNVARCSVASCYRNNYKCKGYTIERVGTSTHLETKTRLHKIWSSMHERCEDKNHRHYKDYGGRGISVCEDWSLYTKFREWALSNGYNDDLTIDRIDVNGCYEPNNCRWLTMEEQQNNKRNNRIIEFNGETHTLSEWSRITGIKSNTLKERLNRGWSIYEALTKPVRKRTVKK